METPGGSDEGGLDEFIEFILKIRSSSSMRFFNSAFSFYNCFIYASFSIEFLSDKNKLLLQSFKWSERLPFVDKDG